MSLDVVVSAGATVVATTSVGRGLGGFVTSTMCNDGDGDGFTVGRWLGFRLGLTVVGPSVGPGVGAPVSDGGASAVTTVCRTQWHPEVPDAW